MMDEEMGQCALMNLKTLAETNPVLGNHPIFKIAIEQLKKAMGEPSILDDEDSSPESQK